MIGYTQFTEIIISKKYIKYESEIERKRSKSLDWAATGGFKQFLYINSTVKESLNLNLSSNVVCMTKENILN